MKHRRLGWWAVASVAVLIATVAGGSALLTRAAHHTPPSTADRLAAAYSALADAEEAMAVQRQIADTEGLDLDPGLYARLQATCRRAVAAYNTAATSAPAVVAPPSAVHLDPDAECGPKDPTCSPSSPTPPTTPPASPSSTPPATKPSSRSSSPSPSPASTPPCA